MVMTRRELLAGALTAASLPAKIAKVDRSRISAISDEIGTTAQASIDFAKQYDLQFLELRNVPGGKEYSVRKISLDRYPTSIHRAPEPGRRPNPNCSSPRP